MKRLKEQWKKIYTKKILNIKMLIKNILVSCAVCGEPVLIDQFGYGDCENCGWCQDKRSKDNPDKVIYPNIVPLNKAKTLYNNKQNITPSFDDFIEGLKMYKEMSFDCFNKNFSVIIRNNKIEFSNDEKEYKTQYFQTIEEFKDHASIEGNLLKDIWKHVKNANYMQ